MQGHQPTPGAAPTGIGINDQALHFYMWVRRHPGDTLTFTSKVLAEQLGVTEGTMSKKIKAMERAGRLVCTDDRVPGGKRVWIIKDPADFVVTPAS